MSARPTVTDQLAALHAALAGTRTHHARPMSDEEIAEEMAIEQRAEERRRDRENMSDWTARWSA